MTAASMSPPRPWLRRRRPDWRKVALASASVVINAGLIAVLSLTALGVDAPPIAPEPRPLYVDIMPRPLLPDERPRPVIQPPAQAPTAAPRDARNVRASPAPQVAPTPDARPAPLRPRLAPPAPQGVPVPADPWRVDPGERTNAMARALRQGLVGCTTPDQLNAAEHAHCREDAMRRGQNAAPITGTGNPERDARFAREGARRLAQWEADRRPLSGGVGVVGPADCIGSNFGTGCAGAQLNPSLAPDSTRNVQTRRDGHRAGGAPITPGAAAPMERWKD